MRRAALLLTIAAAALGGCRFGGGSDDGDAIKARRDAQIACLARAKDQFPQASSWEVQLEQGEQAAYGKPYPGEFTGGGAADFNWTFMTAETQRMLPARVVCLGNTDKRQVNSISYDNTIRRPPEGVVWNY